MNWAEWYVIIDLSLVAVVLVVMILFWNKLTRRFK